MAGRSLILAYHNVVPDEAAGQGDQSLHLPLSRYLKHLDAIQAHCEVLPLGDLLAEGPFAGGPHIAITFDDAYRGAVELALPELERRQLPSTLFVAPGLLGSSSFWWDDFAKPKAALHEELRRVALETMDGRHDAIRARWGRNADADLLPECYACASEAQVRALGSLSYVTLGAHSWSHPNLARLGSTDLEAELSRPLEWLSDAGVPMAPVLAYPYGLTSPTVKASAKVAGYTAALLANGGWMPFGERTAWAIPRYNVPAGLSENGFMLRLSGGIGA